MNSDCYYGPNMWVWLKCKKCGRCFFYTFIKTSEDIAVFWMDGRVCKCGNVGVGAELNSYDCREVIGIIEEVIE